MRGNPLKTLDLILRLPKDEAKVFCFFSSLLKMVLPMVRQAHHEGQPLKTLDSFSSLLKDGVAHGSTGSP